ncbi:MAG: calcium/sodium antiporter [Candidatus Woesearchaeota archaeon]
MLEYILLFVGLVLLIKSADFLIEGSSSLANKLGVSTFVIGITVVAFGTSLPELIINIIASLRGNYEVALGNIFGSNMSNTLLILGILALIAKLNVKSNTTWKEIPFSFFVVLLLLVFYFNDYIFNASNIILSRLEGLILLIVFGSFMYYIFCLTKQDKILRSEIEGIKTKNHSNYSIFFMISFGLIGLFFGGKWTVEGAVFIAKAFGISDFLISATIVAIGTSLPELVTSIVAALKKNVDLAVGNIIGSNIFNILWVLGLTAVINPLVFPQNVVIDIVLVLFATALLFLFMFTGKKHCLDKWEGIVFVLLYIAYIVFLIIRG